MGNVIDVPIMAFFFREPPVDGLPLFHHWLSTAKGLYIEGYEGLREIPEVSPIEMDLMGNLLGYHNVSAVKGIGRMSIILFGIAWTYLNKDTMDDEVKVDFLRHTMGKFETQNNTIWGSL